MGRLVETSHLSIRGEAERFLDTYGFSTPPLPSDQALAARKLVVVQFSLDDLLVRANLPPDDSVKIQAMLDANERTVVFKSGLHPSKKHWGSLHEVAHEFIPWQRELLYYCPLLWLPDHVQKQFESEADRFAAEAFFFGKQFHKQAYAGELSLKTAMDLATDLYETSFHATFKHYVRESPLPRCLLIWQKQNGNGSGKPASGFKFHYYVKSKGFHQRITQDQIEDPDEAVARVFANPIQGVVSHDIVLKTESGQSCVAAAESFSNSYNAFTLISLPKRRSVHPVTARSAQGVC